MRRNLKLLLMGLLLLALLIPAASASAGAHRRHHRHHRHHRGTTTTTCANADTLVNAAPRDPMRAAVLCLVNLERTSRGLPALNQNSKLDHSAQLWTNVVVNTGVLSHGSNFAARFTAAGYNWGYAGENIAAGYDTPRKAVAAWMASKDHCRNILDPRFLDVGTGVNPAPFGSFGDGNWTQDFGLPAGHRPPSGNSGPQSGCPY